LGLRAKLEPLSKTSDDKIPPSPWALNDDNKAPEASRLDLMTKLLGTPKAFKIVFWSNVALLVAHVVIEAIFHDVNWRQIGERTPLAANTIRIEGSFTILLWLAIFEMYYPSMLDMVRSKEMICCAIIFVAQIGVWFFYF
jgi:hypothetical protein